MIGSKPSQHVQALLRPTAQCIDQKSIILCLQINNRRGVWIVQIIEYFHPLNGHAGIVQRTDHIKSIGIHFTAALRIGAPILWQAGRVEIRGHFHGDPGNNTQQNNNEYKSHNPFDYLHRESPLAASIHTASISFLIQYNKYIRQPIPQASVLISRKMCYCTEDSAAVIFDSKT